MTMKTNLIPEILWQWSAITMQLWRQCSIFWDIFSTQDISNYRCTCISQSSDGSKTISSKITCTKFTSDDGKCL